MIDVSSLISNEEKQIKIDEEHTYTIDDSTTSMYKVMALSKKEEKGNEIETIIESLKILIGEEATEYVKTLNIKNVSLIFKAVMAEVSGKTLEEMDNDEERFQK